MDKANKVHKVTDHITNRITTIIIPSKIIKKLTIIVQMAINTNKKMCIIKIISNQIFSKIGIITKINNQTIIINM